MKKTALSIIALFIMLASITVALPCPLLAENRIVKREAECSKSADDLVDFALTQEGYNGSYYAITEGISFDWCVWFITFCASNVGLCGTPGNPTGKLFPPIESSTWAENNWAATGVVYEANWFTENDKGVLYYMRRANGIGLNDNTVSVSASEFTPTVGDLIYFDWYPNDGTNQYHHVAIVYAYDESTDTVHYIGGNQGNPNSWELSVVSKASISKNNVSIGAFMRPNYTATEYYINSCDYTMTHAMVRADADSCVLRTQPCDSSVDASSQVYTDISEDTTLEVTGNIINTVGESWYEVYYDENQYYVRADRVEFIKYIDDLYVYSPAPPNGNMPLGIGYPLTETVQSRHLITQITGEIIDFSGRSVYSATIHPYEHGNFCIRGTTVDNNLLFGSLPAGLYTYRLTAVVETGNALGPSENYTEIFTSSFIMGDDITLGDVDGDGNVTAVDALIVMRFAMGIDDLSDSAFQFCDIDSDGSISIVDGVLILRLSIGIN